MTDQRVSEPGRQDFAPLGSLGDYTLLERLGTGGMGIVYKAWENAMERTVALKVLPPGLAADDLAFERFMREARVAGQLSHPNLVAVHAAGIEDETPFYAMEFIEGETLAAVIAAHGGSPGAAGTIFGDPAKGPLNGPQKDGAVSYEALARSFADVADGLHHAHSRGIIHRDIKPANLIVDPSSDGAVATHPRLRIVDFGLARVAGEESLTRVGETLGTPLYMSPEQLRRRTIRADQRTDIYSLGAVLYELLTGRPPFLGSDESNTISRILFEEPEAPRRIEGSTPKDLETIVLTCLRKAPADRYGSGAELAADLARCAAGLPITRAAEPTWSRVARRLRRRRFEFAALAASLALACFAAWLSRGSPEATTAPTKDVAAASELVGENDTGRRTPRLHVSRATWPRVTSYEDIERALAEDIIATMSQGGRIHIDAMDAEPLEDGWTEPEFDDSSWQPATRDHLDAEMFPTPRLVHVRLRLPEVERYERFGIAAYADPVLDAYVNGTCVLRASSYQRMPGRQHFGHACIAAVIPRGLARRGANTLALRVELHPSTPDSTLRVFVLGRPRWSAGRDERIRDQLLAAGIADPRLESYLRARVAERAGRFAEAIEVIRRLVEIETRFPEPALCLARSLRSAGRSSEADAFLRSRLRAPLDEMPRAEVLPLEWARLAFADLGLSVAAAGDVLEGLAGRERGFEPRLAGILWYLDQLAAGGAIRINCGGPRMLDEDGDEWGADGGFAQGLPYEGRSPSPHDGLWRRGRYSEHGDPVRDLRVLLPLPNGRYRVKLYFVEPVEAFTEPGLRVFGISVEDRAYERIETTWGGDRVERTWVVDVDDGALDIRFDHEELARPDSDRNPYVTAIEVERAEAER